MKINIVHRHHGRPHWMIRRPAYGWLFIHLGMWVIYIYQPHAIKKKRIPLIQIQHYPNGFMPIWDIARPAKYWWFIYLGRTTVLIHIPNTRR